MIHNINIRSERDDKRNNFIALAEGGGESCTAWDASEGSARNKARGNLIALLEAQNRLAKDKICQI